MKKGKGQEKKRTGVTNYPVGNFIIAVKNACLAGKNEVEIPVTKLVKSTALALKKMGYLSSVEEKDGLLLVKISYKDKKPVLIGAKLVSTPGLRRYMKVHELDKLRGPSQFLITTSSGVISLKEAKKNHLGGEVIAEIW